MNIERGHVCTPCTHNRRLRAPPKSLRRRYRKALAKTASDSLWFCRGVRKGEIVRSSGPCVNLLGGEQAGAGRGKLENHAFPYGSGAPVLNVDASSK